MKAVSRGVALSMLSTLNCDVSRPISDWRLNLLRNDSEREIIFEHYTKLKAQDLQFAKEFDVVEQKRKEELERVLSVKLFDESQYDSKILARAEEIKSLEEELKFVESKKIIFKPKIITPKKRRITKKMAAMYEESHSIEIQRAQLESRSKERELENHLNDDKMNKRTELSKSKKITEDILKLVSESAVELANIRAISARYLTQKEADKVRRIEEEQDSEMAHYRAIESHTEEHLSKLRVITAESPGWQLRTHQLLNTGILTLTCIITAFILPGLYALIDKLLRCHGVAQNIQIQMREHASSSWSSVVRGVQQVCLYI